MELKKDRFRDLVNHVIYTASLSREKDLNYLEEYFERNITDFNKRRTDYQKVPTQYPDIYSRMCIYCLDIRDNHQVLLVNRDTKEIRYLTIGDSFGMKEATTFYAVCGDHAAFRKFSFNSTGFFVEDYRINTEVKTDVYDIDKVKDEIDVIGKSKDSNVMMTIDSECPIYCLPTSKILSVCVRQISFDRPGENRFSIEIRDKNGQLSESIIDIIGTSLYSVYYDFMIERGYFTDNKEKSSVIKKEKI